MTLLKMSTLFLLLASSTVQAETPTTQVSGCEDVRLDQPGGTYANMDDKLQQNMQNCQTHTGISLYDAWRFSHQSKDKRRTSPSKAYLDVCSTNAFVHDEDVNPGRVLEYLKNHRPCALKDSEVVQKPTNFGVIKEEKLETFAKTADSLYRVNPSITSFKNGILSCAMKAKVPIDNRKLNFLTEAFFDPKDPVDISYFVKLGCDPKDHIEPAPPYELKGADYLHFNAMAKTGIGLKPDKWQSQQLKEINQCLTNQKEHCQPFSVGYCHIVTDKDFVNEVKKHGPFSIKQCGGHAVTLIGRRYNQAKKRCEFLLRNSNHLADKATNSSWEHASGNDFWMDQEALMAATANVVQLQEPKKKDGRK